MKHAYANQFSESDARIGIQEERAIVRWSIAFNILITFAGRCYLQGHTYIVIRNRNQAGIDRLPDIRDR